MSFLSFLLLLPPLPFCSDYQDYVLEPWPRVTLLRSTFASVDLFFILLKNGIFVDKMGQQIISISNDTGNSSLGW